MKAVYYCRVSTEEESQVNALENQIQEARDCIIKMGWDIVDGYVDEGKSGTQTHKRNEYNRLVNDLETNKYDIIVIKSQDRLMRNVMDWYKFLDKLTTNGKKLFFYLDDKFYTSDDALINGIKVILAEEYSRDLSKKLNNRHRGRQEKGSAIVITSKTWGYDKVNKQIVINENEAKIVRLIYDLYIQGYGSRSISKELSNRGVKSRTGNDFAEITVRRIIKNPLFKGTAVMNKRHKDFDTKKTIHNPESQWIYHENAVPPIVPEEIWNKANEIMKKKSKEVRGEEFSSRKIGVNIGKYSLSSKIFCGECSSPYWRRYRKTKNKGQVVDWSCSEYVKRGRTSNEDTRGKDKIKLESISGGCDNVHIKEEDLNNVLFEVAQKILNKDKENVIDEAISFLNVAFDNNNIIKEKKNIEGEKEKIINQKNLLLDKLLDNIITNEDYKRKDIQLEEKLNKLLDKETQLLENENKYSNMEERINDIKNLLKSDVDDDKNYETLVDHIEKIIVYKDHIEVYFDLFEKIRIDIQGNNKNKKYLYVDTAIYLIPHTDTYRYEGKFKDIKVKVFI
jgi:DNA invertase Pin-like site-specific DNA recombinase